MIRHVIVDIRRNEGATIRASFPEWEIPVIQAVHGVDAVTEVGDRLVNRPLPGPEDEFQRLTTRYKRSRKEDGSYDAPYAHMVYGQLGVHKLAEAMRASLRDVPEGDLVGDGEKISSVGG